MKPLFRTLAPIVVTCSGIVLFGLFPNIFGALLLGIGFITGAMMFFAALAANTNSPGWNAAMIYGMFLGMMLTILMMWH